MKPILPRSELTPTCNFFRILTVYPQKINDLRNILQIFLQVLPSPGTHVIYLTRANNLSTKYTFKNFNYFIPHLKFSCFSHPHTLISSFDAQIQYWCTQLRMFYLDFCISSVTLFDMGNKLKDANFNSHLLHSFPRIFQN